MQRLNWVLWRHWYGITIGYIWIYTVRYCFKAHNRNSFWLCWKPNNRDSVNLCVKAYITNSFRLFLEFSLGIVLKCVWNLTLRIALDFVWKLTIGTAVCFMINPSDGTLSKYVFHQLDSSFVSWDLWLYMWVAWSILHGSSLPVGRRLSTQKHQLYYHVQIFST